MPRKVGRRQRAPAGAHLDGAADAGSCAGSCSRLISGRKGIHPDSWSQAGVGRRDPGRADTRADTPGAAALTGGRAGASAGTGGRSGTSGS